MKNQTNYKTNLIHKTKSDIIVCKICNKTCKSISSFGSHIVRKHNLHIDNYCDMFFKLLTKDFKVEKCGFCNNDALPVYIIDWKNCEYSKEYINGYACKTDECINNISLEYFNKPYKCAKKQFEYLGAKSDYLARLYKKDIEYVKNNLKMRKGFKLPKESLTNLYGYISRYGEEEGTKKYQERNNKISKSHTLEWYIEKFGIEEGKIRFESRYEKILNATSNIQHSKNQYFIFNELNKKYNNIFEAEKYCGGVGIIDILCKSKKIGIEYFGDYWHCNPKIYNKDYYNQQLKMYAYEKNEKDMFRLQTMLKSNNILKLIVIWENSFLKNQENIFKKLYNIIDNINIDNKKEIIWI